MKIIRQASWQNGLKLDLAKVGRIWILRAENRKDTLLRHGKNSEKKGKSYLGGRFRGRASLLAQRVKNPPAVWETWIQSLGWKNPLEKGMAAHSSVLIWRTPWTEEPGELESMGSQRVGHH